MKFKMKRKRQDEAQIAEEMKRQDEAQISEEMTKSIQDFIAANSQLVNTPVFLDSNNLILNHMPVNNIGPYVFVIVPRLRYGGRDIIKIGIRFPGKTIVQAFYRSSGMNTKTHGTFMPFDGIGVNIKPFSRGNVGNVFLDKTYVQMSDTDFREVAAIDALINLKSPPTHVIENHDGSRAISLSKYFTRLANCYTTLMSYLLGGPAWDETTESSRQYVETFKGLCEQKLKSLHGARFIDHLLRQVNQIRHNMTKFSRFFFNVRLYEIDKKLGIVSI